MIKINPAILTTTMIFASLVMIPALTQTSKLRLSTKNSGVFLESEKV